MLACTCVHRAQSHPQGAPSIVQNPVFEDSGVHSQSRRKDNPGMVGSFASLAMPFKGNQGDTDSIDSDTDRDATDLIDAAEKGQVPIVSKGTAGPEQVPTESGENMENGQASADPEEITEKGQVPTGPPKKTHSKIAGPAEGRDGEHGGGKHWNHRQAWERITLSACPPTPERRACALAFRSSIGSLYYQDCFWLFVSPLCYLMSCFFLPANFLSPSIVQFMIALSIGFTIVGLQWQFRMSGSFEISEPRFLNMRVENCAVNFLNVEDSNSLGVSWVTGRYDGGYV